MIGQSEKITLDAIDAEPDVQVRRCMIEIVSRNVTWRWAARFGLPQMRLEFSGARSGGRSMPGLPSR